MNKALLWLNLLENVKTEKLNLFIDDFEKLKKVANIVPEQIITDRQGRPTAVKIDVEETKRKVKETNRLFRKDEVGEELKRRLL